MDRELVSKRKENTKFESRFRSNQAIKTISSKTRLFKNTRRTGKFTQTKRVYQFGSSNNRWKWEH